MKPRLMIVDDEKCIRITMEKFLVDAGYDVEVAEDSETALAKLTSGCFDVVVTDIIMPRITGISLLKTIKKSWPKTRVILMTGDPTLKLLSPAEREEAADYLEKPVNKEQLLESVGKALQENN